MPPITDRALALRERQIIEALEILTAKHGAHSESAAVVRHRLEEIRAEIEDSKIDHSGQASHTGDIIANMGGPQVKDAGLMFVILGMVLLVALGGMSTMFVLMMAVKW